ncbi:four helix bundle protein [Leptolyngbya sp. 7M]|nr:four helix bundle protein [Leptolyngbya sp. 7M]QYO66725.1 four helix bundle protein [Leptolyngbya sp. 7M]
MQDRKSLNVWQHEQDLTLINYKLTGDLPQEEAFVIRHSLQRNAVDIPA